MRNALNIPAMAPTTVPIRRLSGRFSMRFSMRIPVIATTAPPHAAKKGGAPNGLKKKAKTQKMTINAARKSI